MALHQRLAALFLLLAVTLGCSGPEADHDWKGRPVPGKVILRAYVVRHAEAYKNTSHPPDMPDEQLDSLTPKGHGQAVALGELLEDKGVAAVIVSPTGRTRETGDAIGAVLGLDEHCVVDESFAPLSGGETAAGGPVSWAWRVEQWKTGRDPRPDGGESLTDGATRAAAAIEKLAREYPGKAVAIVTHGDICAALLGKAADTPIPERYEWHDVPGGSAGEILITEFGWYLASQGLRPAGE